MFPNYYKRLGVNINATSADIKKSYRTLAIKYHPDRNKSNNAHNLFIDVNEAYTILYNKQTRAKYDIEYQNHFNRKRAESFHSHSYTHQRAETYDKYRKRQQKYYQQKEASNRRYTYEDERPFEDDDLNKKANKAKEKAAEFAAMAFKKFSKIFVGFAKETLWFIFHLTTGVIGFLLMLISAVGLMDGLSSNNGFLSLFTGLAIFLLGFLLTGFSDKKKAMFQFRYSILLLLGVVLTFFGIGHIALNKFSDGETGGLVMGFILLPIGILIWRYSINKKRYN